MCPHGLPDGVPLQSAVDLGELSKQVRPARFILWPPPTTESSTRGSVEPTCLGLLLQKRYEETMIRRCTERIKKIKQEMSR